MRLFWLALTLAALVLASWWISGGELETQFTLRGGVQWLERAGPWGWLLGIGLLLGDVILPIPSTVVVSSLGYIYGTVGGGILASTGLILSGLAGYGIGRVFGEPFVRRWLGDRDFDRGQALFSRGGSWIVAITRALPVVPEVISCMAGLVRMPFAQFVKSLASGSVPMGFLFAAIGALGHRDATWAFALSLILPGILWWVAAKLHG